MTRVLTDLLLWCSALGCGVMAGLYFAFSTFIMSAFGAIGQSAGIAAMQSINVVIVRSIFLPLFFGTTLIAAILIVLAAVNLSEPGAASMLTGALIYVIGMFVVTVVFNVPLNDTLAGVDPESAAATSVWQSYMKVWTSWNHVRTLASLSASGLFIHALIARAV